jgi:catechol 2,3-dioxygenase-like lactoylglutathione lyase family enzyme
MRMTDLVPMLQTDDMARTRNWYEEVLGFRCVSSQSDGWCRLERDDIAIMFTRNAHLGSLTRRLRNTFTSTMSTSYGTP